MMLSELDWRGSRTRFVRLPIKSSQYNVIPTGYGRPDTLPRYAIYHHTVDEVFTVYMEYYEEDYYTSKLILHNTDALTAQCWLNSIEHELKHE